MLCQIVTGPQFQNFTLKCCFFIWRRAAENVDCYPKMGLFKKMFLEPAPGGSVLFDFFKAKNVEKLNFCFACQRQKTSLPILGAYNKMFKQFEIRIFFFVSVKK